MKTERMTGKLLLVALLLAAILSLTFGGRSSFAAEDTAGNGSSNLTAGTSAGSDTQLLNGFVTEKDGYTYYYENSVKKGGWVTDEKTGKTYYFYKNAHGSIPAKSMVTDAVVKISGYYYYFNSEGVMQTGWVNRNGNDYYFKKKASSTLPKGAALTGLVKINGYRYYFTSSGKMKTGWKTINGSKYYFKKSASSTFPKGAALTGLRKISGSKYYFASNGKMKTGLRTYNGKKYYFNSNGKMVTSTWKSINGYDYYFKSNGAAATGGYKINGTIYVFKTSGKLATHSSSLKIVGVSGKYYCVDSAGKAQTSGWITVGSKLCYAAGNGRLKTNTTYQGITFNSAGYAEDSTAAKLKIMTMDIVSSITTSNMTQSQKLRACWNYMVSKSRFSYRTVYISSYSSGWQITMAYNMLNSHSGNCYSFACAFAALAYEIGYDPYVVVGRVKGTWDGASDGLTRHCWVKINGCYYDPEACFAGWWTTCYGVGSYSITHQVIGTYRFALS